MSRAPRPERALSYVWRDGGLDVRRGGNAWRLEGEHAARVYACARSVEARGLSPGRVLGRALNRRYLVYVERTGAESDGEARRRAIREDDGGAGLEPALAASLIAGRAAT